MAGHMNFVDPTSKDPIPDVAERGAFFPSAYALSQFTSKRSDLSGEDYLTPYRGGRWKVLVIGADERYLPIANGTLFSTGNHPVETLLPMYHMEKAGFRFEIATLSGNSVKFEHWAMPEDDERVMGFHARHLGSFRAPKRLQDIVSAGLGPDSDYAAVFIPGGHGALIGLPGSSLVRDVLIWALREQRLIISLCHGPAAFLSAEGSGLFKGSRIVAFPDALDDMTPSLGYMPGQLTWKFGERLAAMGFELMNDDISGKVYRDGLLLTGDSPLAGNALGRLAAEALLDFVSKA